MVGGLKKPKCASILIIEGEALQKVVKRANISRPSVRYFLWYKDKGLALTRTETLIPFNVQQEHNSGGVRTVNSCRVSPLLLLLNTSQLVNQLKPSLHKLPIH